MMPARGHPTRDDRQGALFRWLAGVPDVLDVVADVDVEDYPTVLSTTSTTSATSPSTSYSSTLTATRSR